MSPDIHVKQADIWIEKYKTYRPVSTDKNPPSVVIKK